MKWLPILSLLFVGFLVYRNIDINHKSSKLQWKIDSIQNENSKQFKELELLKSENDSLQNVNDSLRYKQTIEIYNQIEYRYGKEIENISASDVYECIDILTN